MVPRRAADHGDGQGGRKGAVKIDLRRGKGAGKKDSTRGSEITTQRYVLFVGWLMEHRPDSTGQV